MSICLQRVVCPLLSNMKERFALVKATALHPFLPEQLSHAVSNKIDIINSEMLEALEFGEQRKDLGDVLPLLSYEGPCSKAAC